MENQRIVISGASGYLGSALGNALQCKNDIVHYPGDVRTCQELHENPSIICHFASPSDDTEFKDTYRTSTTIIEGTINMVNIAKKYNAKLVFASTMGVYDVHRDDIYASCKLAMEHYIKSVYNNYIILRIPRVYSKCRSKGLMKKIRNNTIPSEDMLTLVEYITLQEFVNQTMPILNRTNITHEYEITNKHTIGDIKQWLEM